MVAHFPPCSCVPLALQAAAAEAAQAAAVRRAEAELTLTHASAAVVERKARAEALDGIRTDLNVLSEALAVHGEKASASHSAHKLALGVMGLEGALKGGRAFAKELKLLQAVRARACERWLDLGVLHVDPTPHVACGLPVP